MTCDELAGLGDHGGSDASGAPAHDFSTNANACGPCPVALEAVRAADSSRYPDPAYAALRERLAEFHAVDRERIVIAGSASEFIVRVSTACMAMVPGVVEVPRHAYGDYARAARALGMPVQVADCIESAPATPSALVWACEPSSPLGTSQPGLAERIDRLTGTVPLILDRAYEPLRLSGACGLSPDQIDQVWQLWSPNKALGLTGVRAAYAIAPAGDKQATPRSRLHRLAPSWPLGSHGVAMLESWTWASTQAWLAGCLPTLRIWKARQQALCRQLGWPVLESDANYFCAGWSPQQAGPHAMPTLRAAGIKLRDGASFGLSGHVRLGVRPPASQDALREAVQSL